MHLLLALLRHIHREIYVLGPGLVPVVFSKYRTVCAVLIALLCAAVASWDSARRRWVQAALWIVSAGLLYAGFQSTSLLWSPRTTLTLGVAAIVTAVLAIVLTLRELLQDALARARRERHELRRIPGTVRRDGPRVPPART